MGSYHCLVGNLVRAAFFQGSSDMYGYFLRFFKSGRGRSHIEFARNVQVGMLGYESAHPFLLGHFPPIVRD